VQAHGAGHALGTGVVGSLPRAAEPVDRVVHDVADLGFTSHIGLNELGLCPERWVFAGRCFTAIESTAGNNESATGLCGGECGRCQSALR
jgi:hypothetical protein